MFSPGFPPEKLQAMLSELWSKARYGRCWDMPTTLRSANANSGSPRRRLKESVVVAISLLGPMKTELDILG
jgi:hypothetical protein